MTVKTRRASRQAKVNRKDAPIMGNVAPLAATSSSGGFNPSTLILILIVVVAFYLLMIRPQQRRKQQAQQQRNTVQPGARVRTTAGMYATVVDVDGDDVILEVAPGVEVRYMKRAVMDVVSPGDAVDEDEATVDEADEVDTDSEEETEETDVHDAEETADKPAPVDDDAETAYEQATGSKKD
jgi:preprotein translocase subunit YajC